MRALRLWLLVMAAVFQVRAGVGEWKTFTAKRDVRDVARSGAVLWSATSGGLFGYDTTSGAFLEYTTSEGLKTIDLTAIAADNAGGLWIGASNGTLHKYSPLTGQWRYITDIALLDNPQKRINALRVAGDTLFILSEVGLSLYSVSRSEFGDTYARFGAAPGQIAGGVTSMALLDGALWVGTRSGIASTSAANPNPASPDSWQVVTAASGLPSNNVTGLAAQGGLLYASTAAGIAVYAAGSWTTAPGTAGVNALDMRPQGASALALITATQLLSYDIPAGALTTVEDQFPSALTRLADPGTLGSRGSGILRASGGGWTSLSPAGPPSNKFISLAVGARGVLWAGTGASSGEGAMRYDGLEWKSYTAALYPELKIDEIHKVSIGANNAAWLSSWGSGAALVDDAGVVRRVLNAESGLPPTLPPPADPSFVVVNGVAIDRYGFAWITNRTAPDSTAVVLFLPDSSLNFSVRLPMRDPDIAFTDVAIDFNNTKWFANYSRFENASKPGLLYYNEGLAVPGSSGGWGRLASTDGLTSDAVWCVAVDRQGEVWVGSDAGISILFDPLYPKQRMAVYHPLRDQVIQAIAVDALNNKWIGTKQGAALLSPDGTSILAQYTVASTEGKLLDDDVASIAIDHETGTVYFGTEKGLSALTTAAVSPVRSFEELAVSPNPYVLPSRVPLTVDGLVQGSTLKVLTVEGKLVREIATPGGRIGFWDGRDADGNLAATGVYLVVAFSEDGSKVKTAKVAVVKR